MTHRTTFFCSILIILLAFSWSDTAVAESRQTFAAISVQGQVEYRPNAASSWKILRHGMRISAGAEVRVATRSRTSLRGSGGGIVRIRENTKLTLPDPELSFIPRFTVDRGSVNMESSGRGGQFTVTTPISTVGVRGTNFLVTTDDAIGADAVSVWDGVIEHSAQNVSVRVERNFGSTVERGLPPGQLQALPTAPVIIKPADRAKATAGVVNFEWEDTSGARAHLLEIALDNRFTDVVLSRTVESDGDTVIGFSIPLSELPEGTAYWRISTLADSGLEGAPSVSRVLYVPSTREILRDHYRNRQYKEAIDFVGTMKDPELEHRIVKAWSYYRLSDLQSARIEFEQLYHEYPESRDVKKGLGFTAFRAERLGEAERYFVEVLMTHPNDPSALNGMGLVRYKQERWAEAIPYFERSLNNDSDNSEARKYLLKSRSKLRGNSS